jgi:hypothetical protein
MKKLIPVLLLAVCLTGIAMAEDMIKAAGSAFINSAGEKKEAVLSGKIVGFFFSSPRQDSAGSRMQNLVKFYSDLKQAGSEFEIIQVGGENSEAEMLQNMREAKMPWLAVPYTSEGKEALQDIKRQEINYRVLPALIIVRDGQVITKNGMQDIVAAGSGAYQKWLTMEPETFTPTVAYKNRLEQKSEPAKKPIINKESISATPGPLPPPEKEKLTMDELRSARLDLDGKVIKTTVTDATLFTQVSEEKYSAYCGYYRGGGKVQRTRVLIPKEGNEFFQTLEKANPGSGVKTVYLLVHSKYPVKIDGTGYPLEAVGTHYNSDGRYSW